MNMFPLLLCANDRILCSLLVMYWVRATRSFNTKTSDDLAADLRLRRNGRQYERHGSRNFE